MASYNEILNRLETEGNLRTIPSNEEREIIDFSTNDYMGLATRIDLREEFFSRDANKLLPMSSSASRLLASCQKEHNRLEELLEELYGRPALLFNSGYHANTGVLPALAEGNTFIVADKLSHASIIDGMVLSRAKFTRYPHNDYDRLERIVSDSAGKHDRIIIVTESIFSMDGDRSDIERLADIKRRYRNTMLYVDEAHAFGVTGKYGLGLSHDSACFDDVDVVIGTFGKAAASAGAFASVSPTIKAYLINRARSFIFSTALSPMTSAWTRFMIETLTGMEDERLHVKRLSLMLHEALHLTGSEPSHIAPFITGDSRKAIELSTRLKALGYKALPIRTPTVPAGTERIRFSLSASMSDNDITGLGKALSSLTS